jgi:NifU-like protein involved in Fe-S cluster formation
MSGDPYSAQVRALFAEPLHVGELDRAATVQVEDQGIRLRLEAKVAEQTVEMLRFRAFGCPHLLAAAEAFCREHEGRPVADMLEFRASGLMQSLPVPVEKTGRILVLEDAVRSLGQAIRDGSA